jgi:hypothetical protein
MTVYDLSVNGRKLRGKSTAGLRQLQAGGTVYVQFPAEKVKIFPK